MIAETRERKTSKCEVRDASHKHTQLYLHTHTHLQAGCTLLNHFFSIAHKELRIKPAKNGTLVPPEQWYKSVVYEI